MQKVENTIYQVEYDLTVDELKRQLGISADVEIKSIQFRSKPYDPGRGEVVINGSKPSELNVTHI